MPCRSDYMEATGLEIETSRVLCILEELEGKKPINPDHWRGYHPIGYGGAGNQELCDKKTAELCAALKRRGTVADLSLEAQMWWRDHQRADTARERAEAKKAEQQKARKKALSKLSPEERRILGLKD